MILFCYSQHFRSDAYCEQSKAKLTVQNAPAWCDRVLFRTQDDVVLASVAYDSTRELRTSDHRPVSALFHVELPLAPHPFAAQAHAYQLLLYDVVAHLRRPSDVLRAASGDVPSPPARALSLRVVSRVLSDKASRTAVAPRVKAPLQLHVGSDPPRYQTLASCIALGPFVALGDWCRAGEHLAVLVTDAKSDDSVLAQVIICCCCDSYIVRLIDNRSARLVCRFVWSTDRRRRFI